MQKMLEIFKQADDPSFRYTDVPKGLIPPQMPEAEPIQALAPEQEPATLSHQQIFNEALSKINIDAIMDELVKSQPN